MFKEEEIIDGVLCWRSTPDGEWKPYTAAELTARHREAEARVGKLRELTAVQNETGNWDFSPYMHGMANALELALAVIYFLN